MMNDVFNILTQSQSNLQDTLNSIDQTLRNMMNGNGGFNSNSNNNNNSNSSNNSNQGPFGQHHANANFNRNRKSGKSFLDEFERTLYEGLGASQLRDRTRQTLQRFADRMGVQLEDLDSEFGKRYGQIVSNTIKNSKIGSVLESKIKGSLDKVFNVSENTINDLIDNLTESSDLSDFSNKLLDSLGGQNLGKVGNKVVGALNKLPGPLKTFTVGVAGPVVALKALEVAGKSAAEIMDGVGKLFGVLGAVSNRYYTSREKGLEAAQKRLEADVETMIKKPFEILEKAANEVYQAWNANIRLITGTQGYDKAGLQDLMSAYAARIQKEGLQNVIPATDLIDNLSKVIQSGLTGNAAVEFAYQATKYNAALPNQDFFSYVDSYSSVAANAIAAGKSEAEALNLANQSLKDFSNGLLYASRTLVGGYSIGLKSADSIYNSAVKIAQTAKSENISGISNALLAIQGYVGSIAPDLASNLSEKIYQLATGGNNSDIVALRSLAGINASNTEFLREFSKNPQSILSNMFANLGRMYTESPDAYMEKAEGYSSLFGLSSEAFQRIDFNSLANAITNMSDNSNYLEENMKLLKEGQTTTSADQQKIAQINKYMVEEGLAYVIDNEAAQMIQQHMWDEQIAREMQETTYGVEIVGTVAEAINKILSAVERVLSFLNPFAWGTKISSVIETIDETKQIQADVKKVLELGVVGKGNREDLYNLTTRNTNLQLTKSLVEIMGGTPSYVSGLNQGAYKYGLTTVLGHPLTQIADGVSWIVNQRKVDAAYGNYRDSSGGASIPKSNYSWGLTSKAGSALASAILQTGVSGEVSHNIVSTVTGAVSASVAAVKEKLDQMLSEDYLVNEFVKKGKSYEDWRASASDFGIVDVDSAMKESGYDATSVEDYFKDRQMEEGLAQQMSIAEEEREFRQAGLGFWNTRFWEEFNLPLTALMNGVTTRLDTLQMLNTEWRDQQLTHLQTIVDHISLLSTSQSEWQIYFDTLWTEWKEYFTNSWTDWKEVFNTSWIEESWRAEFTGESGLMSKFFDEFVKKFIEHTYYDESGYKYADVEKVQRKEKAEKGDAVYALAEALTNNMVDLKDPQVQTNALLSQILIVVSAIMNQNNNVAGTTSLADALSGLAVGLTKTTPLTETPLSTPTT